MKISQVVKKHQNTIVLVPIEGRSQKVLSIIKELSGSFKRICIMLTNKSCDKMLEEFKKAEIDHSKFYLIDCTGKSSQARSAKLQGQCGFVDSQSALTSSALAIEQARNSGKSDLLIFDEVSIMQVYNDKVMLEKFFNSIMTNVRKSNTKGAYMVSKEAKELISSLSLFADEIVEL